MVSLSLSLSLSLFVVVVVVVVVVSLLFRVLSLGFVLADKFKFCFFCLCWFCEKEKARETKTHHLTIHSDSSKIS